MKFLFILSLALVASAEPGLVGEYFKIGGHPPEADMMPEGKPFFLTIDKQVNFRKTRDVFNGSKLQDNFLVRWTGSVNAESAGNYGFSIESDDGSTLYIDDKLVIDNWGLHAMTKKSATIELAAGQHAIRVHFHEAGSDAGCILRWTLPGKGETVIPAEALSHKPEQAQLAWDEAAWKKAKVKAQASKPAASTIEGLEQLVFVDQEHISSPTGMSVSPQGVVFVSCDRNGASNKKMDIGRVVRCEDTDGDGVADRFTNFIENFNTPRGSCYVDDTLFLLHPPFFSAYRDTNGDGVADDKKVLVEKLGLPLKMIKSDHGQNAVRMGIDGWLYLAIGDQGCYEATGTDGSQATLYGGGVLRVRPDGSLLEIIALNTRNIYDVAVDPYLDLFARDNTNDGGGWNTRFHHITELADFGYPRLYKFFGHEIMQPLIDYGGGSGTGMYYVHEPGLPGDYGDALYSGDFNTGVAIHRRKAFEASWQVQQQKFMNLPKNMDIDVDGFSRIYAASWQGGGFGYTDKPFGHVSIVRPTDTSKAAVFPDFAAANHADLLKHLASRSQVTRIHAMRQIVKRGKADGLLDIAKDANSALYVRVAAIMTLKQVDGPKSHDAIAALYGDASIREFVLRALGDRKQHISHSELFLRGLRDDNPRVQLRAIVGLARAGDPTAADAILPLAASEKMITTPEAKTVAKPVEDGFSAPHRAIPHTALKAVVALGASDLCFAKLADPELRETALRALQEMPSADTVAKFAKVVAENDDADFNALVLPTLFRLYHQEDTWDGKKWWGIRPNFKGPYFKNATWEQTEAVAAVIKQAFERVDERHYPELFENMRLNGIRPDALGVDGLYDEIQAVIEKESLSNDDLNTLINTAANGRNSAERRLACYRRLCQVPGHQTFERRAKVIRSWGGPRAKEAALKQAYHDFVAGNEFADKPWELKRYLWNRRDDINKYAHLQLLHLAESPVMPQKTRDEATKHLSESWENKDRAHGILWALLDHGAAEFADQVRAAQKHADKGVRNLAQKVAATLPEKVADAGKRVGELPEEQVIPAAVAAKGDAEAGKALYVRQGCNICHTTSTTEQQKGPYLGAAGSKFTREFLAESLFKPNAVVSQGFKTHWFTLKDGSQAEGFVTRLDGDEIDVRNIIGQVTTIQKADIDKQGERENSMMPPGLMNALTIQEFASLLDYLQTLKAN